MLLNKLHLSRKGIATVLVGLVVLGGAAGVYLYQPRADVATTLTCPIIKPTVSAKFSNRAMFEEGRQVDYLNFTRTGSLAGALTVKISFNGNTPGSADYPQDLRLVGEGAYRADNSPVPNTNLNTLAAADGTSVTFPAGAKRIQFKATPIDDSIVEETGTVRLLIVPSDTNAYLIDNGTGGIPSSEIYDNDGDLVTIHATDDSANEDGDQATMTVSRSHQDISQPLIVALSLQNITTSAVAGEDYRLEDAETHNTITNTVTLGRNQRSKDILVKATDDTLEESDETFKIKVESGLGYRVARTLGDQQATVTIKDNDSVVITVSRLSQEPYNSWPGFVITSSVRSHRAVTVNFELSGTGIEGTDYNLYDLSTPEGRFGLKTTARSTISVGGNNTVTLGQDKFAPTSRKTVMLTLKPGAGYRLGNPSQATETIGQTTISYNFSNTLSTTQELLIDKAMAAGECPDTVTVQWQRYNWLGSTLALTVPKPLPAVPVKLICSTAEASPLIVLTDPNGQVNLPGQTSCKFPIVAELMNPTEDSSLLQHFDFATTRVTVANGTAGVLTGILPTVSGRITRGGGNPPAARNVCISINDAIITGLLASNQLAQTDLNECGTTKGLTTAVPGLTETLLSGTSDASGYYSIPVSAKDIRKYSGIDWQLAVTQCVDAFHTFTTNLLSIKPQESNRNDAQEIPNPNK